MANASIVIPRHVRRGLGWGAFALLLAFLLLGSDPSPSIRLALQAAGIAAVLILIWLQPLYRPIRREGLLPIVFMLAVIAVPLVQLVPLPFDMWSRLPGRDFVVEAYRLAGLDMGWRPLTLDPQATRAALAMLAPPLAILLATFALDPRQRLGLAIALAVAIGLWLIMALVGGPVPGLGFQPDLRGAEALADLRDAAELYMPWGSGVGSFADVHQSVERFDRLQPVAPAHAGNDYLELLIETGIIGPLLALVFGIAFAIRTWRLVRRRGGGAYLRLQRGAAAGIAVLLALSALGHPLRSIAMASAFAFLCAILFSQTPPEAEAGA